MSLLKKIEEASKGFDYLTELFGMKPQQYLEELERENQEALKKINRETFKELIDHTRKLKEALEIEKKINDYIK